MTLFTYINQNIDRIKKEVNAGLISCSLLSHWHIYSRYDIYRKMGNGTVLSVFYISEECHISEATVYKVIKKMESEYESLNNQLQQVIPASEAC